MLLYIDDDYTVYKVIFILKQKKDLFSSHYVMDNGSTLL